MIIQKYNLNKKYNKIKTNSNLRNQQSMPFLMINTKQICSTKLPMKFIDLVRSSLFNEITYFSVIKKKIIQKRKGENKNQIWNNYINKKNIILYLIIIKDNKINS